MRGIVRVASSVQRFSTCPEGHSVRGTALCSVPSPFTKSKARKATLGTALVQSVYRGTGSDDYSVDVCRSGPHSRQLQASEGGAVSSHERSQ